MDTLMYWFTVSLGVTALTFLIDRVWWVITGKDMMRGICYGIGDGGRWLWSVRSKRGRDRRKQIKRMRTSRLRHKQKMKEWKDQRTEKRDNRVQMFTDWDNEFNHLVGINTPPQPNECQDTISEKKRVVVKDSDDLVKELQMMDKAIAALVHDVAERERQLNTFGQVMGDRTTSDL